MFLKRVGILISIAFCTTVCAEGNSVKVNDYIQYLKPKPGVELFVYPTGPIWSDGLLIWGKEKGKTYLGKLPWEQKIRKDQTELNRENVHEFFEPVTNENQVLELCKLTLHGFIIEDKKHFDEILGMYQKPAMALSEEKNFDQKILKVNDGYDVSFTAFVLDNGMGVSAHISRYYFSIRDGKITDLKKEDYLLGPLLNWQTMVLSVEQEKKNNEIYQQTTDLINKVFETAHGSLLPFNEINSIGFKK